MKPKWIILLGLICGLLLFAVTSRAQSDPFHNKSQDYQSTGHNFAQANPAADGGFFWCLDCITAANCSGGHSNAGAWAWWQPATSSWACGGSLPSDLLTSDGTTFGGDVVGAYNALVVEGWEGIELDPTTMGAPTNGQQPVYNAIAGKWQAQTVSSNVTGIQSSHNVYGGSPITVNSGSAATILSVGLTMPSSGCPCRVQAMWNLAGTDGASIQLGGWVTDGTNVWAGSQSNTGAAHGGTPGAGISPVTYANSASVTITLKAQTDSGTFSVKSAGVISANIPTYLDLLTFSSN
jgi:hypothetical protein